MGRCDHRCPSPRSCRRPRLAAAQAAASAGEQARTKEKEKAKQAKQAKQQAEQAEIDAEVREATCRVGFENQPAAAWALL